MVSLHFWIPGFPAPAGSKRAFCIKKGGVYTGRAAVIDSSGERGREWRASVSQFAFDEMKSQGIAPLTGPLFLGLTFHMPRPKSHFNSKGELKSSSPQFHTNRPDCTKLTRAVEDAMAGIVYRDDSQIVSQQVSKVYSIESGCWVTIREVNASPDDT